MMSVLCATFASCTLAFIALAFEHTGNLQYSGLDSIFKFNEWHLFVIRGVVNHEFKIQTFFAIMHYFIFVGTKVFFYGKVRTKNFIHTFAYYWMLHLLAWHNFMHLNDIKKFSSFIHSFISGCPFIISFRKTHDNHESNKCNNHNCVEYHFGCHGLWMQSVIVARCGRSQNQFSWKI